MSKFTPGPWRTADDAQGPCMVFHPTRAGVAIANLGVCHKPVNGYHEDNLEERNANARLIAEAPAMAELLQRYLASADSPLGMAAIADIDAEARALLERINK